MKASELSLFTDSHYSRAKYTPQPRTSLSFIMTLYLVLMTACQDDIKSEPSPELPTIVKPTFKLSGELTAVKPMEGVISVGGFNLISEATEQLKTGLTSFLAAPLDLREIWLDSYVQTDLMFSPKFVEQGRPLRIIQIALNGEVYTVHIIGVTDIKALRETLGSHLETLKSSEGTIYIQNRYKGDKNPLRFIEIGQGLIASTDHEDLLKANI